jgi:hypothetical protein
MPSPYLAVNSLPLDYHKDTIDVVQRNNRCWFDPYKSISALCGQEVEI